MIRTTLLALLIAVPAAPATAQVAVPDTEEDVLFDYPDTYPGAERARILDVDRADTFRPATPGCVGADLPEEGYGGIPDCQDVNARPDARPGIVIPLD